MSLHDHFSHLASTAAEVTSNGDEGNMGNGEAAASGADREAPPLAYIGAVSTKTTPMQDAWTLEFISVFRVRQLMEAIDADVSSFISVPEINAFTAARPKDWR